MRSGTKAQLAAERKVNPSRVSRWNKRGLVAFLPDGSVDLDESHRRLDEKLSRKKGARRGGNITSAGPVIPPTPDASAPAPAVAPQPGDPQPTTPAAAAAAPAKSVEETRYWIAKAQREELELEQAKLKTRRDKAETEQAEMKALQMAGALVSAAGVERQWRETARKVRNSVMVVPDRISPVIDPAAPARTHKLMSDELQKALRELSTELEARAADAAGSEEPATAVL